MFDRFGLLWCRNLTPSQTAAYGVELAQELAAEAKARKGGRPKKGEERIPQVSRAPQTRDQVAAEIGVNPHYLKAAEQIKETAPEVLYSSFFRLPR